MKNSKNLKIALVAVFVVGLATVALVYGKGNMACCSNKEGVEKKECFKDGDKKECSKEGEKRECFKHGEGKKCSKDGEKKECSKDGGKKECSKDGEKKECLKHGDKKESSEVNKVESEEVEKK